MQKIHKPKTSDALLNSECVAMATITPPKRLFGIPRRLGYIAVGAALCGIAWTCSAQTTYTWTGAGDGITLANAANWSPSGPPSGATQDTAQWDGVEAGNLLLVPGVLPSTGYGTEGIFLVLTSNQLGSVTIHSTIPQASQIGLFQINVGSGAGAFTFGDATANQMVLTARPAGSFHSLTNNSGNPVTINSSVQWQAGGGSAFTLDFCGTGTWIITNNLRCDNNAGAVTVELEAPSTMIWAAGLLGNYNSPLGPIGINGGTMILESAGLAPYFSGTADNFITNNGTLLEFNAAGQVDNIARIISGSGPLEVNNGTVMLSGANTYSNITIVSGGELIVGSTETNGISGPLGEGGEILFTGGTLGFSAYNTFDYSPRFSKAADQAYSIDTGGLNVTFTNGLTSSGGTLTKIGPGTLTLAGTNTYSGTTTVEAGELVFQGPMSGSGDITVADGATLGVTATGTQVTPGTLTLGASAGAALTFNDVSSTTTAPLAAGTLSTAGTLIINVNSGTFTVGKSYPLLTWTSGSAPSVSLGILNGYVGNLSFSGNSLLLTVTGTAYVWTGLDNGSWDLTTPNNWIQNGGPAIFANGGPALLDDSATGATNLTINALVKPASVTVNNSSLIYSIASSAGSNIAGGGSLTKSGSSALMLSGGANTYTGATTVSGGTLSVSTLTDGGLASDIGAANNGASNLVFNGGTLQYTGGGASSDHLFTIGTGGGAIDASGSGGLTLDNTGSVAFTGTGARVFTLTGSDTASNLLAASLGDYGGKTSLAMSGAGTWVLTGTNTYSGGTTVDNGTLQIGTGGASGAIGSGNITVNSSLNFDLSSTLTLNSTISGGGSVTSEGSGTLILAGNNSYTGGTTISAGTLQVGNGGASGKLYSGGNIVNNATLIFNSTGAFTINAGITVSGTGQLVKKGSGLLALLGTSSYTGGTTIASGAKMQICSGNQGSFVGNITNNGTLYFVRQDNGGFIYTGDISGTGSVTKDVNNDNVGDITLEGTNTYTGGTFIAGGAIILGDGATPGAGSIVGNVVFTNSFLTAYDDARTLTFNRPDDFIFSGVISGSGSTNTANMGVVLQEGPNRITFTANNTYTGGTTISSGVVQVGNGGTTGAIGTNNVTDNSELDFDRSDNVKFGALISGSGSVVQLGSGTLTLSDTNTYTGATIVSNGTLVVNEVSGDMDVSGGTLAAGAVGSVGTLNVAGNMNISSGTVVATLNKALSASNSLFNVSGIITNSGGALKLLNFGPSLETGDQFTIFNQSVTGLVMTVVSPGFIVTNNLASNGTVTVASVAAPGTDQVTATISGGQLKLSWPAIYTGLHVQTQTNSVKFSTNSVSGISTNWVTIAGTDAGNSYSATVNNNSNVCVFYRLAP